MLNLLSLSALPFLHSGIFQIELPNMRVRYLGSCFHHVRVKILLKLVRLTVIELQLIIKCTVNCIL